MLKAKGSLMNTESPSEVLKPQPNRAFSCCVIAAMLKGKSNTFSFIVSALQHESPLYKQDLVDLGPLGSK